MRQQIHFNEVLNGPTQVTFESVSRAQLDEHLREVLEAGVTILRPFDEIVGVRPTEPDGRGGDEVPLYGPGYDMTMPDAREEILRRSREFSAIRLGVRRMDELPAVLRVMALYGPAN